MPLRALGPLLSLLLALLQPANGQASSIEDGFKYFSDYCMDNFPDVEKIEVAINAAHWTRLERRSEKRGHDQFFWEAWASSDGSFSLLIRNFGGRIWCSVDFQGHGELPTADLMSHYSLHEEKSLSDEMNRRFSNKSTFFVFSVRVQEKSRNVLIQRDSKHDLDPVEFHHQLTINDFPVL